MSGDSPALLYCDNSTCLELSSFRSCINNDSDIELFNKFYIGYFILLLFSLCSVKQGLVIIVAVNHGLAAATLGVSLCSILVDVRNTPISTTVPAYFEKQP